MPARGLDVVDAAPHVALALLERLAVLLRADARAARRSASPSRCGGRTGSARAPAAGVLAPGREGGLRGLRPRRRRRAAVPMGTDPSGSPVAGLVTATCSGLAEAFHCAADVVLDAVDEELLHDDLSLHSAKSDTLNVPGKNDNSRRQPRAFARKRSCSPPRVDRKGRGGTRSSARRDGSGSKGGE